MSTWSKERKYKVFLDETPPRDLVYSPVSTKYHHSKKTKKSDKPRRQPLQTLNYGGQIAGSALAVAKKIQYVTMNLRSHTFEDKVQSTFNRLSQKITGKPTHHKVRSGDHDHLQDSTASGSPKCSQPWQENSLEKSAMDVTDEDNARAISHSSGSSSVKLAATRQTPLKRRRAQPDEFDSHLELISCGISQLKKNRKHVDEAIENIDEQDSMQSACEVQRPNNGVRASSSVQRLKSLTKLSSPRYQRMPPQRQSTPARRKSTRRSMSRGKRVGRSAPCYGRLTPSVTRAAACDLREGVCNPVAYQL